MLKRKYESESDEIKDQAHEEQEDQTTVQKKLVGTWMLQSFMNKSAEGAKRYPFGEHPVGQLYYGTDDRVGVHIMNPDRKPIQAATHYDATPEESKVIVNQFFAYCGTYNINTKEQLVEHRLEAHICPNNVGDLFVRKYEFLDSGELSLTMKNDPNKQLVWKKVADTNTHSSEKLKH